MSAAVCIPSSLVLSAAVNTPARLVVAAAIVVSVLVSEAKNTVVKYAVLLKLVEPLLAAQDNCAGLFPSVCNTHVLVPTVVGSFKVYVAAAECAGLCRETP